MCTMHSCTVVLGKTASMASGNPFSPSTQAIRMSWTPRLRSSVTTCSQELGAFIVGKPKAKHFLLPGHGNANGQIDGFDPYGSLPDFDVNAVQIDDGVDRIEWPGLPGFDFVVDGVRH